MGSPKNPPKSAILDKWPPQQIADFANVGPVAQVVEHVPFKHRVAGSSPARLTNAFCELRGFRLCFEDSEGTLNESGPSLDRDNLHLRVTEFLIELRDGQAVLGRNALLVMLRCHVRRFMP